MNQEKVYIKIKKDPINLKDGFIFENKIKEEINGAYINDVYHERIYVYESEKEDVFGKVFIDGEWLDLFIK